MPHIGWPELLLLLYGSCCLSIPVGIVVLLVWLLRRNRG